MRVFYFVILLCSIITSVVAQKQEHDAMLVPYRDGKKWGYCDTLGQLILKPSFDSAGFFIRTTGSSIKLACALKNNKVGLINLKGQFVLAPRFESLDISDFNNSELVRVRDKGKYGVYSLDGREVIPVLYDYISYAADDKYIVKKGGKFGLLDTEGASWTPVQFDSIAHESLYNSRTGDILSGHFIVEKNRLAYIKDKGTLTELKAEEWREEEEEAPMIMEAEGFQTNYKRLMPPQGYDAVIRFTSFMEEFFLLRKDNNRYGIINEDGKIVVPADYDTIIWIAASYPRNIFIAHKQNNAGVIDLKNNVVIPFEYDRLEYDYPMLISTKGSLIGFSFLNTVYPPVKPAYSDVQYITALPVNNNWNFSIIKVKKEGKWGYVGENGVEYFRN